MARPPKKSLDYFPKDVNFYDDDKIIDLLDEYGPVGVTVYDVILTLVYKNGYYLEIPVSKLATLIVRIIGSKWIRQKDFVVRVIDYCADIGLFDNALLAQNVITSEGIQRRYSEITVRNKVDISKYWLLKKNVCSTVGDSTPEKIVSVTETPVIVTETPVIVTETMSIKEKENKEKEMKVNKTEKNGFGERFEIFWQAYPKKTAKQAALKAWNKLKPDEELLKTILNALEIQKKSVQWHKEGGQYIPYPATWINGRRWEDESNDRGSGNNEHNTEESVPSEHWYGEFF